LYEKVAVKILHHGVVVSLAEADFFDSGRADLKNDSISTLTMIAKILNRYGNALRIEGHTDNITIQTAEFRPNWELSSPRAMNVVHFLTEIGLTFLSFVRP
jgi:chemotaxis protein MotB